MDESAHADKLRGEFYSKWEEYKKLLLGYAMRILGNVADAEDVASQALTNYLQSMERRLWKAQIESTPAYLKGIARYLCFKVLRSRSRETPLETSGEQGEKTLKDIEEKAMRENNPTARDEKEIEKKELLRALPKAVTSKLTKEEKDIFDMHFTQKLGVQEISAKLDKDVHYIRYQLNKLKAKIRYRVKTIK